MKAHQPDGYHKFCPKLWRKTHSITGDYVFDASIEQCKNKDMHAKLEAHLASDIHYGPKSGYNGFGGVTGDD